MTGQPARVRASHAVRAAPAAPRIACSNGRLVAADQPDDAADRGAARQRPPPRRRPARPGRADSSWASTARSRCSAKRGGARVAGRDGGVAGAGASRPRRRSRRWPSSSERRRTAGARLRPPPTAPGRARRGARERRVTALLNRRQDGRPRHLRRVPKAASPMKVGARGDVQHGTSTLLDSCT